MKKVKNALPEFLTINYEKEYPGFRDEYREANMKKMEKIATYFFTSLGFKLEETDEFNVKGFRYFKKEKIEFHYEYFESEYRIHKRLRVTRNGSKSNRAIIKNIAQAIKKTDYKIIENKINDILNKDYRKNKKTIYNDLTIYGLMDPSIKSPYAATINCDGNLDWLKADSKEVIDFFDVNHYVIDHSFIGKKMIISSFINKRSLRRKVTIKREDFC